MSEETIKHRVFGRCVACGRDVARWVDVDYWWHLDRDIKVDHEAKGTL